MSEGSCYGCLDVLGEHRNCNHDVLFTDSRTGRRFCHECIACLVSWELDGMPEADDPDCHYPEWTGQDEATPTEAGQPTTEETNDGE